MEIADMWIGKLSRRSMFSRTLLFAGILSVLFLILVPIVLLRFGSVGIVSLSFAAIGTLVSGLICLGLAEFIKGENAPIAQMTISMGIRMGVLLGLCFLADQRYPELLDGGLLSSCLIFYMVGLAAETVILVSNIGTSVEKVTQ